MRFGERYGTNLVYVTLHEANVTDFVFSEVVVERRTAIQLKLDGHQRSIRTRKLTGDGTGYIHVQANHTFYLRGSTGVGGVSKPAVNLNIDRYGTAIVDSSFYVVSDGVSSPDGLALKINGQIIGMHHLFITRRRKVVYERQAQTGNYEENTLVMSGPGMFVLATLEVHDGAKLTFLTSNGMRGVAGRIDIKYGARILADKFEMSEYCYYSSLLQ